MRRAAIMLLASNGSGVSTGRRMERHWRIFLGSQVLLASIAGTHVSCQSAPERRQSFVKQHYADDFRLFKGVHLFVRGRNAAGHWQLALSCPTGKPDQSKPLTWVSVSSADSVVAVRPAEGFLPCQHLDSAATVRIVRAFLRYKLSALSADEVGNISFGFRGDGTGTTELTRLADSSRVDKYFWEDYVRIQGPWYERKDAQ